MCKGIKMIILKGYGLFCNLFCFGDLPCISLQILAASFWYLAFMKVYTDTSVIGGYFDKEFQEWSIAL